MYSDHFFTIFGPKPGLDAILYLLTYLLTILTILYYTYLLTYSELLNPPTSHGSAC